MSIRSLIRTVRRRRDRSRPTRPSPPGGAAAGWRPHIAVVVPTLQQAGAERVALTLAAEFSRYAKVTVVTFAPRVSRRSLTRLPRPPWSDRVPAGCDHVHLPAASSGVRRLVVLATRFAWLARQRRFGTVYSFLTYTNILVALARLVAPGRYVHIAGEHAMADTLRSSGPKLRVLAHTLPLVYRLPERIVAVSDAARHSLHAAGVVRRPDRAVTIHNPIDLAAVRELARDPHAQPDVDRLRRRGTVVACFARLQPQKDHRTLLRALRLLPSGYCLLLVGEGPLREELQRLASELGVADRTVFLGAVDNPYAVMSRVDVIALSSVEEGFGLVALEAAALGVPFVGSDVGGLSEVCAVLGQPTFPRGDAAALAEAIVRLSTGPVDRVPADRLGRFGVATVAGQYLALAAPWPVAAGVRVPSSKQPVPAGNQPVPSSNQEVSR